MSPNDIQIKISADVKLDQLRAMEAQLQRQIVQLRTLGQTGGDALGQLERNLRLVRSELAQVGRLDKLNEAFGETIKSIPVVGTAMSALNGSAATVGAAFLAGTYAITQFRASLNFADQLQDTSDQLDVSASSLQALNAHFADGGVKSGAVVQTLLKLRQSLSEAAAGNEILQRAFANLGLDVARLRALSLDEALAQVGAALRAHADGAQAAAAAQDILGRGTGRLANALKDLGGQGLDKVKDDMRTAGRVLDDAMVKRLADANQRLEKFQARWTIFKDERVADVMEEWDKFWDGGWSDKRDVVLESFAIQSDAGRGLPRLREPQEHPAIAAVRAASAKIAADAAAEEARKQAEIVRARAAAAELAKQMAPIQAKQADLDARMLALHTSRLPVAEQILALETDLAATLAQMPADEDASLDAAAKRLALGERTLALDEQIGALRARQRADEEKARAEDEEWLERTYAAEAARITARQKELSQLRDMELSRRLSAGDTALSLLDQSPLLLDSTRDSEKLRIIRAQRDAVAELLDLRLRELALDPGPERQRQVDELRAKDTGLAISERDLAPLSAAEGMGAGLVDYLNQIPDASERARASVLGIASALEGGLAGSIQGLIDQTMTWQDALANIGRAVVNQIVTSFARMVAQWITQQIIMFTVGHSLRAAQLAALLPVTAATTAMWMPAATAASIATLGGAAATGATAAHTAVLASATPVGYAEGGLVTGPGSGTSDSIPAWLSNGEYVIPASRVSQYGPDLLDDIRSGRLKMADTSAAPSRSRGGASAGRPLQLTIAATGTASETRRVLESSSGQSQVLDIADRGRLRLGIPG